MKNHEVCFVPHPPVILKEIGMDRVSQVKDTVIGMQRLAKRIADRAPSTIVFVTPHGTSFKNGTCILHEPVLKGSFAAFGNPEIKFKKRVNQGLSEEIFSRIELAGFAAALMDRKLADSYGVVTELDHGVMVPMYFIDQYYSDYDIVHITPGFTVLEENYQIGKIIGELVEESDDEIYVVCSGDLSHALKDDGPYAYNELGPVFDTEVVHSVTYKDPMKLLALDDKICNDAAQCGLRSILMGFGSMDGYQYDSEVLSYEGPFGVGYMTGYLRNSGSTDQSAIESIKKHLKMAYDEMIEKEDNYIKLARMTIEHYVETGKRLDSFTIKSRFPDTFISACKARKAGVFVSIHKHGALRGCIGTTESITGNLVEEIVYNAISACSADPRFNPVLSDELDELEISVDILGESEAIENFDDLDVEKYGVIVEKGMHRGLLLPNLEGINSVEEQVDIAMRKAGIHSLEGCQLYRFQVERHEREKD